MTIRIATCALAALELLIHSPALAQGGPTPEVRRAVERVEAMAESTDEAALRVFVDEALSEGYRARLGERALDHVRAVREAAHRHAGDVGVLRAEDGSLIVRFGGPSGVDVRLRLDAQGGIELLERAERSGGDGSGRAEATAPGGGDRVGGPPSGPEGDALRTHVRFITGMGPLTVDEALARLERDHLAPAYLMRGAHEDRRALVERIRRAAAMATSVLVERDDRGVHIRLLSEESVVVSIGLEQESPWRIASLSVELLPAGGGRRAVDAPPLSWDDLPERLRSAEAAGFSGVVVVRRAGREVLRQAYGHADRATGRRMDLDQVFGIGSAPIDFTVTAALLLAQRGVLDLDAPIGTWFPNVPSDKAALTPRMILRFRSGLPDFHHTPDDWDRDLAWIDRETAVRRILAAPLLFAPGSETRPSHSAMGLLAAIVESASGRSYRSFVREEILEPLGMDRTGFYGETLGLAVEDFAVGTGVHAVGLPNIPPNWGPTSWLVMGSGGMFSTLRDMERYHQAIAAGTLLQGEFARMRSGPVASQDGSDRGYVMIRADDGNGTSVLAMMNILGLDPQIRGLMQQLFQLVLGRG